MYLVFQAVCCDDHVHCCPHGSKCDNVSEKCVSEAESIPWSTKVDADLRKLSYVKCDSTHECASGQTCCKLSSGEWGCCPIPDAVCCSDHSHCCPSGTTCDVSQGKCNKGDVVIDWFEKMPSKDISEVESVDHFHIKVVFCPDGSECEDGQTCCRMSRAMDTYGCCPLPNVS